MPEQPPRPRVWLCATWEERDALVRRYGRERLRVDVLCVLDSAYLNF